MHRRPDPRWGLQLGLGLWMLGGAPAFAQPSTPTVPVVRPDPDAKVSPEDRLIRIDFGPQTSLFDLVLFFGPLRQINFMLGDAEPLKEARVTVLAPEPVTADVAWQTFLSALDATGYRLEMKGRSTATLLKTSQGTPEVAESPA